MLDIYIPTFGRSDKLKEYSTHVHAQTITPHRIVYIVEEDDKRPEVDDLIIINKRSKNYAGAINTAWDTLCSDVFFAGADDLRFYPEWDKIGLSHLISPIMVVGTNDLHNEEVKRGEHATHYFVSGEYIKTQGGNFSKDEPVLPEVYDHNYTDREFIGIAKFRGVFTPCLDSVVEHLHFTFGLSQMDDTYKKTRQLADRDASIYESRRTQWNRL